MDNPVVFAISVVLGFALGYWLWGMIRTKPKWYALVRKTRCRLGDHAPGPIRDDERGAYTRCDYCDCIVHRFDRDNSGFIRRIK